MVTTMNKPKSLLVLAVLALTLVFPAAALAEESVKATSESLQSYEQQLKAGEVQSATFNRHDRRMILTLKNGSHVFVHYEAHADAKLESDLRAHNVNVIVLSPAAAEKEAQETKTSSGHTLRWIVIGVVVILLIAAGVYFATRKNRERE